MPNLILLTLLAAFPALSTDMYLPAIPTLQEMWNISLAQANLSLVVYFATFSLLLLVHGPLSDRMGRKPILFGGILLFIAGCLLCAASWSIVTLVLARMVQATGAAAASALSLALAKDLYEGKDRQKVLAYIGVIVPLCPMVAPTLGGFMLHHLSWRWIFICQGLLALISFYGVLRLTEPTFEKTQGGVSEVAKRYLVLLKNKGYVTYNAAFCIMPASMFAFVAASSNIYIVHFGVSEQAYGLYFGFNALCLMCGSLLCSRLCVNHSSLSIMWFALVGMLLGGVTMLFIADSTPLVFMLSMGIVSVFIGLSRPISYNVILDQVDKDVGAASAVLNFSFFLCGAVAMELISFDWDSKTVGLGILAVLGAIVPAVALAFLNRRRTEKAPA